MATPPTTAAASMRTFTSIRRGDAARIVARRRGRPVIQTKFEKRRVLDVIEDFIRSEFLSRSQNFSIKLLDSKSLMSKQYSDIPIALIRETHLWWNEMEM